MIGVANPAERYREDCSVHVHDTPFEQRCAGHIFAVRGLQKALFMDWAEICVHLFSAPAQSTASPGQTLVDWTLRYSLCRINILCRFLLC